MNLRSILFALLCICGSVVYAQLSVPGTPPSFEADLGFESAQQLSVPALDMTAIEQTDQAEEAAGLAPRFGFPHPVSYDLTNTGTWTELGRGDRMWQLRIAAPDAKSINLLYDQFYMPAGARLYIYNVEKTHVIGAFSERNNKQTGKFATGIVYGDEVVVEYYEPMAVRGQGVINISTVVHGYRYIPNFPIETEEDFGDSGSCQVNVNCSPEGDNWQDEKDAVALILVSGFRNCTGSMVNTTSGNCDPYFLTADHCVGSLDAITNSDASFYSFYWNYESGGCSDGSDFLPPSTNGATLLANDSPSDFALFTLTEDPADDPAISLYYNGWDATTSPGVGGVGIHHPSGDIKKIATHTTTPVFDDWFGSSPATSHWEVFWDATINGHSVTEGGSSGSPLYNAAGRVIGQLHGGSSINCSNPALDPGIYGAMSYSWLNGGATDNRRKLEPWLDDAGTGALILDGKSASNCGVVGGPCLTYCPSAPTSTGFEWVENVTLGSLSNTSGDNSGYANFGVLPGSDYTAGQSYSLSLTPGFASTTYGEWFKVYIDFNQDGDFDDAGEEVFDAGGTSTVTVNGIVSIPATAATGLTGMRVIMRYSSAPTGGCDDGYSFGETEDYCINILDPCGTYCASMGLDATLEWVDAITVGSYTNASGADGGYADFGVIPLDLSIGAATAVSLTAAYSSTVYNEYWDIWIDLNRDGDFDDPGENLFNTPSPLPNTVTGNITVPSGTATGPAKMRIRMNWSSSTVGLPCGDYSFGETEDYCVNIVAGGCSPGVTPSGLSSTVTATQVQLSWNSVPGSVGCRLNGGPVPSFAGSATLASPGVDSYVIPVSGLAPGNYNWRVTCACSISPLVITGTSAPDFFTVPAPRIGNLAELGLAPNPTSDNLRVSYEAAVDGDQVIQVTDILGQVVLTENVVAGEGFNTHVISVSELSAGTYFLTIGSGEDRQASQFEVIK